MEYEAIIGLEVHTQLLTESKMFCGCSTRFGAPPNSQTCPVCLGLPGVLPVINRRAVEFGVRAGLATHCTIARSCIFARKNYFYPDLPKNYQISQYEEPLCSHGYLDITVGGRRKRVGITRAHLEEDAGKNIHDEAVTGGRSSFVDLNRTGIPLLEIVSEPDMRSPEEAAAYLKALREIVIYLDICDGNMEEGSFRCDANVSVRPVGRTELGVKTEVKNMNSFKFVEKALAYEAERQIEVLSSGGTIVQETRLFDSRTGTTSSMRGKEFAHDYRYFPEPDLVPLVTDTAWVNAISASLPELPPQKRERFVKEYGIPEYDAEVLTVSKSLAAFFEECVRLKAAPKAASNWIMSELLRELNRDGKDISESPVTPRHLVELLSLIENGSISGKIAKGVFEEVYRTGTLPGAIVKDKGLVQITDAGEVEKAVREAMARNPEQARQYREGKDKLLGFFVGQVMKATKGKANPDLVNKIVKEVMNK